jgi:periplasmic divalent cation tolerance protein
VTGIVSVYVVFGSAEEADRVGRDMVAEGFAACVNILAPATSHYRWEGTVETAVEVPAIFKSAASAVEALVEAIAARHSYQVPAITVWPVDRALERYARWVRDAHDTRTG